MHLDAGFTKVSLLRTISKGLADGGLTWDIPTSAIPSHLRAIGSEFVVCAARFTPESNDSADDLRRVCQDV